MAYTTINKGSSYFNTVIYSGNGVDPTSITTVGFKPDWLWIKSRSNATAHLLFDAVRGVSKRLVTNNTNAESTETSIASFDTNGWTMDADTANNGSGRTYVAWNWLGANTTVSNTQGSITSTVSANTTAGFSIVSYTGNGSNGATIGHGLGATPSFLIVKNRTAAESWQIYSSAISGMASGYLQFDSSGFTSGNTTVWSGTSPTSSVFSVGTNGVTNTNTQNYIAYCFAAIKGYSKFGSYTGNGSADGAFVYTGFKPAFLIIKQTNTGGENWYMWDTKRDTYNVADKRLFPNLNNAEETGTLLFDFLSNGFKLRSTYGGFNGSGGTYIYATFAENPFVTSGGIPVTAR